MATEDLDRYTPKNWQFLCGVVVEYYKRVFWRLKRINVKEGVSKIMRDMEGNLKGLPPT